MTTSRLTHAEPAVQPPAHACNSTGHDWQPTIIVGYFLCGHCNKLAACVACVSNVRGNPVRGYCQTHQHLRTCETEQEVLG